MSDDKWISVEDRLPDGVGIDYLVTVSPMFPEVGVYTDFYYYQGDGRWYDGDDVILSGARTNGTATVTHWMPLPEPSK